MPNQWLARKVLNDQATGAPASSPTEVAEALKRLRNALEAEAIDDAGRVDYAALADSPTYAAMQETSGLLTTVDPADMRDDETRIAFWINLYNVLAIHGVLELGIEESVMEVPSFFGVVAYRVGDFVLTLDEIENGVLRRNAPHPATRARLFDDDDPRLALCPTRLEPRIHAALVCASTSCPPVAFYEASKLDAQLDLAAVNQVQADVEVDDAARTVHIPIIFRYYQPDFGRQEGVWLYLIDHARNQKRKALEHAREKHYEIDYHRYDWSLNRLA